MDCFEKNVTGNCECLYDSPCGYITDKATINDWDVSQVDEMVNLFRDKASFNADISKWNTSSVKNFKRMFSQAVSFNQDIGQWNTSGAKDMTGMFYGASKFNQSLTKWNTSSVTSMAEMFQNAVSFNSSVADWDVSKVGSFAETFRNAGKFNGDLSKWDTKSVTSMAGMFSAGSAFNNPSIQKWNTSRVQNMERMLGAAGDWWYCDNGATQFSQEISRWDWDLSSVTNMNYMFHCSKLQDLGIRYWVVRSDVRAHNMFGLTPLLNLLVCPGNNGPPSACYMKPLLSHIRLAEAVEACFKESKDGNCKCLETKCGEAQGPISVWNTSGIMYMQTLFKDRTTFNEDLSKWDMRSAVNTYSMFENATAFNQDISRWDLAQVTDTNYMFKGARSFDYDISDWILHPAASTRDMFLDADAYIAKFTCSNGIDGPPSTCSPK